MSQSFFSPNKSNTGAAVFFSFNSKDAALYAKFVKQNGWNDKSQTGIFLGGKKINVKFNLVEIGEMLQVIASKSEWSGYHGKGERNNAPPTTVCLKHYSQDVTKKDGTLFKKTGFSFWAKNGEDYYKLGLTSGAGKLLSAYLTFVLNKIFTTSYAADKKKFEESLKQKVEKPVKSIKPISKHAGIKNEYIEESPKEDEEVKEESPQTDEFEL